MIHVLFAPGAARACAAPGGRRVEEGPRPGQSERGQSSRDDTASALRRSSLAVDGYGMSSAAKVATTATATATATAMAKSDFE